MDPSERCSKRCERNEHQTPKPNLTARAPTRGHDHGEAMVKDGGGCGGESGFFRSGLAPDSLCISRTNNRHIF